jgi:hypothetical protein
MAMLERLRILDSSREYNVVSPRNIIEVMHLCLYLGRNISYQNHNFYKYWDF